MLNESFEVHSRLNPKLWGRDNKLLPEVKDKIVEIVSEFEDDIEVPIQVCDVQLVGSNASYNYNEASDLDIHIVANFEIISEDTVLLQRLYDAKKTRFNDKYDIKLRGIDVEIYVQDVKSSVVSNGIYSVLDDNWIKEPKPIKKITQHNVEEEKVKWRKKIKQAIATANIEEINDCISMLYLIRHNSIAADGEYGAGNQLFKELRADGLIKNLKDARVKFTSKELSIEEQLEQGFTCHGNFITHFED